MTPMTTANKVTSSHFFLLTGLRGGAGGGASAGRRGFGLVPVALPRKGGAPPATAPPAGCPRSGGAGSSPDLPTGLPRKGGAPPTGLPRSGGGAASTVEEPLAGLATACWSCGGCTRDPLTGLPRKTGGASAGWLSAGGGVVGGGVSSGIVKKQRQHCPRPPLKIFIFTKINISFIPAGANAAPPLYHPARHRYIRWAL